MAWQFAATLLRLRSPIAKVQIRNPYNDKDFEKDKLSILELRAKDEQERIFTIEVQLSAKPGLTQRVVFYGCEVYAGQLLEGNDYWGLKAAKREGREEGIEIGEAKSLRKTIHFCQLILSIPQTPLAELELLGVNELNKIATELQSQVRGRAI